MRIACFVMGVDTLLTRRLTEASDTLWLAQANTPEAEWAAQFWPAERLIEFRLVTDAPPATTAYERILLYSDLGERLAQAEVTHLVLTTRLTASMQRWLEEKGILPVCPAFRFQSTFENKLWFDHFLSTHALPKPLSQAHLGSHPPSLLKQGPVVVQRPESWGGEGTFFVDTEGDWQALLKRTESHPQHPWLVRQRVKGDTYGIAVLVTPWRVALSALAQQCFYPTPLDGARIFAGLQWIPSAHFAPQQKQALETVFWRVGSLLQAVGYRGYANFDFLIDDAGELQIIECNARFTAAASHLMAFDELSGGISFGDALLAALLDEPDPTPHAPRFSGFPESTFEGSFLFPIAFPEHQPDPLVVERAPATGVYAWQETRWKWQAPALTAVAQTATPLAICSNLQCPLHLNQFEVLASVVSAVRLFAPQGQLNPQGQAVLDSFLIHA